MNPPTLPRMDTPGFWDERSMLAFWEAGRLVGMEEAAQIAERLRDEHCAATGNPHADAYACSKDGVDCDFVAAWNDVIAAIRAAASPGQWGTSIVSTPEYKAEQREKNRRVRALMDNAAMGRKPDGSAA